MGGCHAVCLGALHGAFTLNDALAGGSLVGHLIHFVLFVVTLLYVCTTVWGVISKFNDDVRPYIEDYLAHVATLYNHRNG